MSIPLGPFTPILGTTFPINAPFQPDRIQAILISNLTPYFLQINGLPGVTSIWHSAWKEDLYYSSTSYNTLNSFQIFPQSTISGLATSAGPLGAIFITYFEVGEDVPGQYPVIHSEYAFILNEAIQKLSKGVATGTSGSGGAAGTLTLTPAANEYIVVQGFNIFFDAPGAAHNGVATLTVGNLNTMSFRFQQESTAGLMIQQDFGPGIQSTQLGSVATLSIPAVSSGANWSANLWGYGVFSSF
jgi:hypothetical protein